MVDYVKKHPYFREQNNEFDYAKLRERVPKAVAHCEELKARLKHAYEHDATRAKEELVRAAPFISKRRMNILN